MKTFSVDWTTANIPAFNRCLSQLKGVPCRGLEIGSHEGRTSLWFAENILTNPASFLVCYDLAMLPAFISNTSDEVRTGKILPFQGTSFNSLVRENLEIHFSPFDFIYVDGNHHASSVLEDSVLAWNLLKQGGILIWDDYGMPAGGRYPIPVGPAVDAFMTCYAGKYEVIQRGWQVAVRKLSVN